MHGLLVEATLVLLAQPTIHCREISVHNFHSVDIWDNVLGPWYQDVSYSYKTLRNFEQSIGLLLHFNTFKFQIAARGNKI